MSRSRLTHLDRHLYLVSHRKLRAHWANAPMVRITRSGTKGTVWIAIAIVLFAVGNGHARVAALVSVGSLLLAEGVINIVLKPAIRRERPYAPRGPGRLRLLLVKAPGAHSWPSAHAGSSMAAAIPLLAAFHFAGIPFLVLAVLIGYSRVYVGVHYPFDVLAGAAIGALCAIAVLVCAFALARAGLWPGTVLSIALSG
jgi:undecaprenyl-diphosphatase